MKKRILAIFLCLILTVSLATAVAAETIVIPPGFLPPNVPNNPGQPEPDDTPVPNDSQSVVVCDSLVDAVQNSYSHLASYGYVVESYVDSSLAFLLSLQSDDDALLVGVGRSNLYDLVVCRLNVCVQSACAVRVSNKFALIVRLQSKLCA